MRWLARSIARSRRAIAVCVILAGILAAVSVWYRNAPDTQPGSSRNQASAIFLPKAVTLAPGLHLLGALSPSVAYVVETDDGLILVDSGLEDGFELLVRQVESIGLRIQDLRIILLTHGHGDHFLGAMNLKRISGAKIYVGRGDAEVLRNAGPREAVFSTFPMDHVNIHPTSVDVELAGGEIIELGDARILAIAAPGHTPGSTCYLLERHGQTALFSGDAIMTITGDLGTYSTYLPPRYGGNAREYLATLQNLREISPPDLLLPGHPRTDLMTISARVSEQQWHRLLDGGIREMEQLVARYDADGADFLDGNPKEILPGLHYLGDFSGTALYCVHHDSSLVLFDAPGGPDLTDFLEHQLNEIGLEVGMLDAVMLIESGPDVSSGLAHLIDASGCLVIGSGAAIDHARELRPDVRVRRADLVGEEYDWLPLQSMSFVGSGQTMTAYRFDWHGKRVLVSGRIPQALLARSGEVQPDVWCPAAPLHGQNANLYGSE